LGGGFRHYQVTRQTRRSSPENQKTNENELNFRWPRGPRSNNLHNTASEGKEPINNFYETSYRQLPI
jgi:hypothetical protein